MNLVNVEILVILVILVNVLNLVFVNLVNLANLVIIVLFFGNFAYFFAFGERFNSSPKFWKTSADVIIAVGSRFVFDFFR